MARGFVMSEMLNLIEDEDRRQLASLIRNLRGQECGRSLGNSNLVGKIVGGYDVGYYKYPWFVTLLLDGRAWCGATLVGPRTVITAAHCYKPYLTQPNVKLEDVFTAKLGVYNNCLAEPTQKEFKIGKVDVHEKYLKEDPYFDIAIIQLTNDASDYEPACLPLKAVDELNRGKDGLIIGLGTIEPGADKYPCNVHEGRVLFYSNEICKSMIMNATNDKPDYAFKNALCAGYMAGGVDTCQGDSGGPILISGPNGREVLLGITSFGYSCGKKNLLGIYTDVSQYLDWIKLKSGVISNLLSTTTTSNPLTASAPSSAIGSLKPPTFDLDEFLGGPPPHYTENPLFSSWTDSPAYPPMRYTPPMNLFDWPPKRIIIEFKRKPHRRKIYYTHKKTGQKDKRKLNSNKSLKIINT